jgi:hypothetical protein
MKGTKAVVGIFTYLDDTIGAIKKVQAANFDYRVYSPFANHEIEEATSHTKSNIRIVSLVGAIVGLCAGFALAIMCSLDWPMRVSAKDIISIPGFVVIGYECTILFGAVATLLAMFHFCRIPDILRKVGYDPRFTNDKFGVVVGCDSAQVDEVMAQLKSAGADEVEVRDGI